MPEPLPGPPGGALINGRSTTLIRYDPETGEPSGATLSDTTQAPIAAIPAA